MPVSSDEFHGFQLFAQDIVANGSADTLQEILDKWNLERARQESIESIRLSVSQYEAGDAIPLSDAFQQVRENLGRTL